MPSHKDDDKVYSTKYPPYVAPKVPVSLPTVERAKVLHTPGEPVKTGGTYTVVPDPAHDAAVQASVIRKNDPPKHDAANHSFQQLAKDIENLTAAGPGKVTQVQLDALHARAQSILGRVNSDSIFWGA